jgi:transcription elongation factor Elf1
MRKGVDTIEIRFLCPTCGKVIKEIPNDVDGGFLRGGSVFDCPHCNTTIELILLAAPPIIHTFETMEEE